MEVSGLKQDEGNDVKLCDFCDDFDITTCADGFCVECEIFLCHKCFTRHKGRKSNRNHSLVKVGDSSEAKARVDDTFEICQVHRERFVEFYCPNHGKVCCGDCIVFSHNGCKLELVRNIAVSFQNSSDFTNLTAEFTKCNKEGKDCAESIKINKEKLNNQYEQFVSDVNTFVDEVMERINTMKNTLLDQAKDIMLREERKMNEIEQETEKLMAELSRQMEQLESKKDQPNILFAASILVKPEVKKIQQQLNILQTKNIVTRYSFKRDDALESTLRDMNGIGLLHEQSETGKFFLNIQ